MEFTSRYYRQIAAHLSGLNVSQRIAIGLCALMVLIGFAWLINWSGEPDRIPLLQQIISADEEAQIERSLKAIDAEFVLSENKFLVRAEDRQRLLAHLQEAKALPAKTSISFDKLMDSNNPFLPREDARWQKERALEAELSAVLAHFKSLADARVFVTVPQRRGIGADARKTSASVYVHSRPGHTVDKELVASIANFVSGAVEGLNADAVRIVDAATGRSYQVPSEQESLPFDVLDLRAKWEAYYSQQIVEYLSYIPGVLVGVNAEINLDRKHVVDTKLGKPQASEEESTNITVSRGAGGVAPGVKPNVGKAVAGGGGGEVRSEEKARTVSEARRDETVTDTISVPGDVRKLTASINVPRSFFVGVFKQMNPQAAAEPKDSDLEAIIKDSLPRIQKQVKLRIAAREDDQVDVNWFYDTVVAQAPPGRPVVQAEADGAIAMISSNTTKIGLGVLALLSLIGVFRISRKAHKTIEQASAAAQAMRAKAAATKEPVEQLETEGGPVGEAVAGETVLEGHEVGEEEIRIRHMIGQIGQMVKEDTSTAASLLDQWVAARD